MKLSKSCNHLLILFTIIFINLPRFVSLGVFLTSDEYLWVDRARNFLPAILQHDWGSTFQTGHPGVTTMWTGSLGLWMYGWVNGLLSGQEFTTFLEGLNWDNLPVDLLPYLRIPTVIITVVGLVIIYELLKRLFDQKVALLAVILLSFDPWYLAHSRFLHHDALMTTFMAVSALALWLHIWQGPMRWALLLSGLCAGLALLSKMLSLFLLPWAALLFITAWRKRNWVILQIAIDGSIWLLTTWLTFFVLWPAMWLNPINTLTRMHQMVETYALNPHEKGLFFLGEAIANPGPLFYPLVAIFALTPLAIIGLVALGLVGRRNLTSEQARIQNWRETILLLLLFSLAYGVFITLGAKKQDRYILPALVMLNIVAAVGLGWLGNYLLEKLPFKMRFNGSLTSLVAAFILLGQAATALPYYPHYLSYYNPLLGGNQLAARWLLVGWGEGTELAANYLNQKPEGEKLTVVTGMPTTFAPFFRGQTDLWWPDAQMLAADYLVLYRRQFQQGQPDPEILNYIEQHWPLETTIQLNGLDYAWIYRAPAADWVVSLQEERITDRTGLLGYKLSTDHLTAGQTLAVTLYYQPSPLVAAHWLVQLNNGAEPAMVPAQRASSDHELTDPITEVIYTFTVGPQMQPGFYWVMFGFKPGPDRPAKWLTPRDLTPPTVYVRPTELLVDEKQYK